MSKKKYELTEDRVEVGGFILRRIRALKDISLVDIDGKDIKAGDLGGYIASELNLSHEGTCWVKDDACVYGDAEVYGDALIQGHSKVYGNASVHSHAIISGNSEIYGDALISGRVEVGGSSLVYEKAQLLEDCHIYGDVQISGKAKISGEVQVRDNARISGNATLDGIVRIEGSACISDDANVSTVVINHDLFDDYGDTIQLLLKALSSRKDVLTSLKGHNPKLDKLIDYLFNS